MAQDERENRAVQEVIQAEQSSGPRIGIGLLAAFLLNQSIYAVLTAFIGLVDKVCDGVAVFQNSLSSLLWMVAWTGGTGFFWKRKKPQLTEWILPFTLFVVYWFVAAPCLPYPEWQCFALAMFLTTGTVWGLAILVRKTGFVLGDGHQQKEQIKRWISNVIPAFGRYHDAPQDILGRISSPPEPSPEVLWQPTSHTKESDSQPLLPNGLPRGREADS
ncbi:MAG: hypothetical protein JWL77_569 [Chthonomonadaceae bacterium]|nr:hypothetical protein [Chthonomonadaceae bacterium]